MALIERKEPNTFAVWTLSNHRRLVFYSTICSGADQRKHQSPASLAFVRGIHRRPVNYSHYGPVTWKVFSFDDVIMRRSKHNKPVFHGIIRIWTSESMYGHSLTLQALWCTYMCHLKWKIERWWRIRRTNLIVVNENVKFSIKYAKEKTWKRLSNRD